MNKPEKIRFTNQRAVILEELRKVTTHPTAYEVYHMVRKRMPHIALGTVYRNLDFLVRSGLVKQVEVKGGRKRFDGNPSPHYHIRCIRCGRVDDLRIPLKSDLEEAATAACDYEIRGHYVEFSGICAQCRD